MNCIRAFVSIATALLATSLSLPPAFGDDYPSKPIKFVVPAAPAGIGDILRDCSHRSSPSPAVRRRSWSRTGPAALA
jgi:hypothetical protein